MYKIKYTYKTGNSFGSHEETGILEMSWNKIENAKSALARINEHYLWYKNMDSFFGDDIKRPKWHIDEIKVSNGLEKYYITLKLDNENTVQFNTPWCGYFEKLLKAEIISENLSIEFQ